MNTTTAPSLSRSELRDQIEAMLKLLPFPGDDFDRASIENNKLILVEDFGVEHDEEFKSLIMNYIPEMKSATEES